MEQCPKYNHAPLFRLNFFLAFSWVFSSKLSWEQERGKVADLDKEQHTLSVLLHQT